MAQERENEEKQHIEREESGESCLHKDQKVVRGCYIGRMVKGLKFSLDILRIRLELGLILKNII